MAKSTSLVRINGGSADLGVVINAELARYNDGVRAKVDKAAQLAVVKLVSLTRDSAPFNPSSGRGHHYRDLIDWTVNTAWNGIDKVYVWFVREPDARLTHLLARGHKNRDHKGRTRADKFLDTAVKAVRKDYEAAVEEAVKNG